jgi:hypothetical protein
VSKLVSTVSLSYEMPRTGARRPSYAPLGPDPSYNFTVDVVNGTSVILTFKGHVASSGAVRASVRVGQKYASGSDTVSGGIGRGVWSDRSGKSRCTGTLVAQRNNKPYRTRGLPEDCRTPLTV